MNIVKALMQTIAKLFWTETLEVEKKWWMP